MTKNEAIATHKIATLATLMLSAIDDITVKTQEEYEFRDELIAVEKRIEKILDVAFKVDTIKSSTYLQDLSRKLDTILRKNYVEL